jgi:hypothetical protein
MRIRTILAAAAVPLALGGVLLVTVGQASAAAAPAVLTASVQQASVKAVTHQNAAPDTTSGTVTSNPGTGYGYVWAYDNVSKQFVITQTGPNHYTVVETVHGSFTAFSSPNTGLSTDTPINVTGSIDGTNTFYVVSPVAPDPSLLPAQSPDSMHTGDMISALFGNQQSADSAHPESGNLWVFTYKAGGQVMTQRYDTAPSKWGNITG